VSGLMASFLLESVGVTNYTIIEGGNRSGGRVHTTCLNNFQPEDYQYHEAGPMRFPRFVKYADTNETVEFNVGFLATQGCTLFSFHFAPVSYTSLSLSSIFTS